MDVHPGSWPWRASRFRPFGVIVSAALCVTALPDVPGCSLSGCLYPGVSRPRPQPARPPAGRPARIRAVPSAGPCCGKALAASLGGGVSSPEGRPVPVFRGCEWAASLWRPGGSFPCGLGWLRAGGNQLWPARGRSGCSPLCLAQAVKAGVFRPRWLLPGIAERKG